MGKSFEYWQHLYDQGTIESHVNNLRLQHLKYAVDHNLITYEEYYGTHVPTTSQCQINYKPCSLIDFCKALKKHNTSKLEIINLPKIDQYSEKICETEQNIINISQNSNQHQDAIENVHESYSIIKEMGTIEQTEIKKKSKKKRKKKSKYSSENLNKNSMTEVIEHVNDEYQKINEISSKQPKQFIVSKQPVKIFVRQANKKSKNETVGTQSLISTKKKTVREIFSNILKQFKMERQKQLQG